MCRSDVITSAQVEKLQWAKLCFDLAEMSANVPEWCNERGRKNMIRRSRELTNRGHALICEVIDE